MYIVTKVVTSHQNGWLFVAWSMVHRAIKFHVAQSKCQQNFSFCVMCFMASNQTSLTWSIHTQWWKRWNYNVFYSYMTYNILEQLSKPQKQVWVKARRDGQNDAKIAASKPKWQTSCLFSSMVSWGNFVGVLGKTHLLNSLKTFVENVLVICSLLWKID